MTWNPTHVQLTVLRARNLPTKGKGGAKLNDVFVTIHLGKEKFQTSTIKNALNPEWFEQCDLMIPHMHSEVAIQVMHRGMLSDDFIGYTSIPLWEYKLYERPKSQWMHLQGKPHKPPDNKNRGELEVRIVFQVKSKTEDVSSAVKSSKRSPKLKALASAVGHKVGDKLKFSRSKSFRESELNRYNPPPENETPSHPDYEDLPNQSHDHDDPITGVDNQSHDDPITGIDFSADSQMAALSNNKPVNFSAIDISHLPEWEDTAVNERMSRSLSVSLVDRHKQTNELVDETAPQYNIHMPGNRRSLPPSYWGTQTLPHPRSKRSVVADDTYQRSADDLNTSVSSQPGYLEAMFHREREVYKLMQGVTQESTDDSAGFNSKHRKTAKEYTQEDENSYDSDTEGSDDEVRLPAVKRKPNSVGTINGDVKREPGNESSSRVLNDSETPNFGRQISRDSKGDVTETSFPEHSTDPVYHSPREESNQAVPSSDNQVSPRQEGNQSVPSVNDQETPRKGDYQGVLTSESKVNGELKAPPRHKKKIALDQEILFGVSPDFPDGNVKRRAKRDSLRQLQGNRRYTVQGLEVPKRRRSYGESLSNLIDIRPRLSRECSVPEDLLTVYRSMNKEELITMLITHKAQLIRKDQYIKDLEDYIDKMLVRVMETDPRLLQHSTRRF